MAVSTFTLRVEEKEDGIDLVDLRNLIDGLSNLVKAIEQETKVRLVVRSISKNSPFEAILEPRDATSQVLRPLVATSIVNAINHVTEADSDPVAFDSIERLVASTTKAFGRVEIAVEGHAPVVLDQSLHRELVELKAKWRQEETFVRGTIGAVAIYEGRKRCEIVTPVSERKVIGWYTAELFPEIKEGLNELVEVAGLGTFSPGNYIPTRIRITSVRRLPESTFLAPRLVAIDPADYGADEEDED